MRIIPTFLIGSVLLRIVINITPVVAELVAGYTVIKFPMHEECKKLLCT
jgi:hypothetical protein